MGLAEKLQEQARYWSSGGKESREVADNYRDAADEIAALRAELDAYKRDHERRGQKMTENRERAEAATVRAEQAERERDEARKLMLETAHQRGWLTSELEATKRDRGTLYAEIERLRAALKPFAAWADKLVGVNQVGDACPLSANPAASYGACRVSDLRLAKVVLEQSAQGDANG